MIEDTGNWQFMLISSLGQLFSLIEKSRGDAQLFKWRFLSRWNSLSFEMKEHYYKNRKCPEFDLFCYFKDRPFFERLVTLHLKNKVDKSVIDHYLLGDVDELRRLGKFETISEFSLLELALLAYKSQNPEFRDMTVRYFDLNNQIKSTNEKC